MLFYTYYVNIFMQTYAAVIIVFTVLVLFIRRQLRKQHGCGCIKCECKKDQ